MSIPERSSCSSVPCDTCSTEPLNVLILAWSDDNILPNLIGLADDDPSIDNEASFNVSESKQFALVL